MARRADHTREELRDLALSAAKSLACQDGLRGVTIRGIAARIGYSVGTLYNVFEDQSDLIVCLNGSILEDLGAHLQAVPMEEPTMAYLRNLAAAYLTYTQENAKLWSLLFEHQLPEGRELPPWYYEKLNTLLRIVENALLTLLPDAHQAQVNEMARILWASLHGIATLSATGKLAIVTANTAQDMANSLLNDYLAGAIANSRPR